MLYEFEANTREALRYEKLLPDIYREGIVSGELFAVAVFDGKNTRDKLVGLVLSKVTEDFQEIVWVGLTEKYSLPEYGADLIHLRTEAAREADALKGTFCRIPSSEERMREYFLLAGYEFMDIYEEPKFSIAYRFYEKKKIPRLMEKVLPMPINA